MNLLSLKKAELKAGNVLTVELFQAGQLVDVTEKHRIKR